MAFVTKVTSSLLAAAFLAAAGFGLYLLAVYAFGMVGAVDPLLGLGLAVALAAVLILAHGIRRAGIAGGTERLRLERRAAAYAGFLAALRSPVTAGNTAATSELTLWASGMVMRQIAAWRGGRRRPEDLAPVLRAMRADLGQSNLGFKANELVHLLENIPYTPPAATRSSSGASLLDPGHRNDDASMLDQLANLR